MATQEVFDISDRPRYTFKKHPFVSLLDDPIRAFPQVPKNILIFKDIRSYVHYKIESIEDDEIHKELEKMWNDDLSLKLEYANLEPLNLVKYMFYTDFENHKWTRIILSRVHDDLLWLGDSHICIDNDLIHKVTSLSNERCNPMSIKNVCRMIEKNLNTRFDGRNMKVNTIQDAGVRLLRKILGYKFNHGSRLDLVLEKFLHVAYVMVVKGEKFYLCDII